MYAQEVNNNAELNVRIGGAGVHGFGVSANNLFAYNTKSTNKNIFCKRQNRVIRFTYSCEPNPDGLFSNPAIHAKDAIYIASVTYGIRILAGIEFAHKGRNHIKQF